MDTYYIDINCDVGEGVGNEEELFPYISSCNIACGGHAGDVVTMNAIVALAKIHNVKIGAHPSYPDKINFGRSSLQISDSALYDSILNQIRTLEVICKEQNITLNHIKPHGALYNDIAKDENLAKVFLSAIKSYKSQLILYVPPGSVIEIMAMEERFKIMREAFVDRNYRNDLSLVPRKEAEALITVPKKVLQHLMVMIQERSVITISKEKKALLAETFCVHGDTSSAFQILVYLSRELPKHNIILT